MTDGLSTNSKSTWATCVRVPAYRSCPKWQSDASLTSGDVDGMVVVVVMTRWFGAFGRRRIEWNLRWLRLWILVLAAERPRSGPMGGCELRTKELERHIASWPTGCLRGELRVTKPFSPKLQGGTRTLWATIVLEAGASSQWIHMSCQSCAFLATRE